MTEHPKHIKLLNLAADAVTIARNRIQDAATAATAVGDHELANALISLTYTMRTSNEVIGALLEDELSDPGPVPETAE